MPLDPGTNAPGDVTELAVSAVPVRSRRTATRFLFRTGLSATALVSLLEAGWVPVDVVLAGVESSRALRHRRPDAMAAGGTTNAEIPGSTDIVQGGRRKARDRLASAARQLGAEGVLVPAGFELHWSPTQHLVHVTAVGDAITQFRKVRPPGPPTAIPLDRQTRRGFTSAE